MKPNETKQSQRRLQNKYTTGEHLGIAKNALPLLSNIYSRGEHKCDLIVDVLQTPGLARIYSNFTANKVCVVTICEAVRVACTG